jgi:hypothetical protein
MKDLQSPQIGADLWDSCALTSLGLDPNRAHVVLGNAVHVGWGGQPALPAEDFERALFEAGVAAEVQA